MYGPRFIAPYLETNHLSTNPSRVKSYLTSSVEPTAANIDWGYSVKPGAEGCQDTILRFVIANNLYSKGLPLINILGELG